MLVFVEGGKPENPEKNPQSKARTNNKLNPHMTPGPRFEPGPHWWEASVLTTAPTLLSHEYLGHAGREHVLSTLRQRFWLLQARTLVRQVLRKCVSCRKRNEAPMQQLMADLPKERLIPFEPPFTYTGVDFFGPFHVKRGRSAEKVYGCLFTCFTSRAVHIEDVSSLETDSFIQALRRFISNRGYPKEIWSDNATNFAGAEKEIRQSPSHPPNAASFPLLALSSIHLVS